MFWLGARKKCTSSAGLLHYRQQQPLRQGRPCDLMHRLDDNINSPSQPGGRRAGPSGPTSEPARRPSTFAASPHFVGPAHLIQQHQHRLLGMTPHCDVSSVQPAEAISNSPHSPNEQHCLLMPSSSLSSGGRQHATADASGVVSLPDQPHDGHRLSAEKDADIRQGDEVASTKLNCPSALQCLGHFKTASCSVVPKSAKTLHSEALSEENVELPGQLVHLGESSSLKARHGEVMEDAWPTSGRPITKKPKSETAQVCWLIVGSFLLHIQCLYVLGQCGDTGHD